MKKEISANEYPLSKILSSDFEYRIPAYQRPYAWTREECSKLFEDLYSAFLTNSKNAYFLGSIILIKNLRNKTFDVVDGQQRLTTLTLLISSIISRFEKEKYKNDFIPCIKQDANVALKLSEKPRIVVREKNKMIFNKYVLKCKINEIMNSPINTKISSNVNIQNNAFYFYEQLKEHFNTDEELLKFGQYILNNCYIVTVITLSQESASRIFSVMNSRGLDLLPTDILKAEIIDKIEKTEQNSYTALWEEWEQNLSREKFVELFYHIRMIYSKNKLSFSLLKEFHDAVIKGKAPNDSAEAKNLIDNVIISAAKEFDKIICQNFSSNNAALDKKINNYLQWLNQIDVSEWKPVAIFFMMKHHTDTEYLLWFLKELERLASVLFLTAQSANERISRFAEVLKEIEESKDTPTQPLSSIELTDEEKTKMVNVLESNVYSDLISSRRQYLILRLDSFISDGSASYNLPIVSIEHVLPQEMNEKWKTYWNEEEHKKWVDKISNLVLLSRRKNSQAQNFDFETKKNKYFLQNGVSSFALTTQVLTETVWTPEVVDKRQNELLDVFKKKWELQ